MSTITTVLGLLPLALIPGEGAELRVPLAVPVIGGLILSTLLTLVIIPVLYRVFEIRGERARLEAEMALKRERAAAEIALKREEMAARIETRRLAAAAAAEERGA